MTSEERFKRLLDDLLSDVEMDDEVERKKAHHRCIDYAREGLAGDAEVNTFLTLAAERLGQVRAHFCIIENMVQLPDDARLHLAYSPEGGPTLTGNPSGLRYLSDVLTALSEAMSEHEHVHLYEGEPPLFGNSYRLTIYNEQDVWFDRYAIPPDDKEGDEGEEDVPGYVRRELNIDDIAAVGFFGDAPPPPPLLLTSGRLYRVLSCRQYNGEPMWRKPLEDETDGERMHAILLNDDAGERLEIALHLDDPDVRFFTHSDLRQVTVAPPFKELT